MTRNVVKYVTSGVARGGNGGNVPPPLPHPPKPGRKGTKGRKEGAKEKEGKI